MADTVMRHAFSIEEWHLMGAVFGEDARVELVEGDVIEMAPIGARHALCVKRLNRLLSVLAGERAVVSIQDPVVVDPHSELQPDLALLVPPLERYVTHPRASDVYLVVEVADSSLRFDRDRKTRLYGRAGVPEMWVVDLAGEAMIVFSDPDIGSPGGYRRQRRVGRGDVIAVEAVDGVVVAVDDVLGPT